MHNVNLLYKLSYYIIIGTLQHVSVSVRHHQGVHLFLAKITCMTLVVIKLLSS